MACYGRALPFYVFMKHPHILLYSLIHIHVNNLKQVLKSNVETTLTGLNTTENNIYSNEQHTTEFQPNVFLTGKHK